MNPLLVAGGALPGRDTVLALIERHSPIVAVDAGALQLRDFGCDPDVIVGDMDSLEAAPQTYTAAGTAIHAVLDQNRNDLEKSLEWVAAKGHGSATLIGVGGGASDHAINNFSILSRWAERLHLTSVEEESIAAIITGQLRLSTSAGERISLIPLPIAVVTTAGLEWELTREQLGIGLREGGSNRSRGEVVELLVHTGCVMAFHFPVTGVVDELDRRIQKKL